MALDTSIPLRAGQIGEGLNPLAAYQNALQMATQNRFSQQQNALQQMQMQEHQQKLQEEQRFKSLFGDANQTQQTVGATGQRGDARQMLREYGNRVAAAGFPDKAKLFYDMAEKAGAKYKADSYTGKNESGRLTYYMVGDDGSVTAAPYAPAEEMKWEEAMGPNGRPVMMPLGKYGSAGKAGPEAVQDLPEGMMYGQGGKIIETPGYSDMRKQIAAAGAGRTTVNVNTPYEPEFAKGVAKLDVETLGKYRQQSDSARAMLSTLDRLEKLNPGVYEAGGAKAKLAAANLLKGMGMNVNAERLANSQEFDALSSKLVMDQLGSSLGAGVSNADVAFLQNTVPNIGHSREARQQLINFMRQKAQSQSGLYDDAYSYALKNKGMMGYNPNQRGAPQQQEPAAEKPTAKSFDAMPDPRQYAGKTITDTQTSTRWTSDGKTWRKAK